MPVKRVYKEAVPVQPTCLAMLAYFGGQPTIFSTNIYFWTILSQMAVPTVALA